MRQYLLILVLSGAAYASADSIVVDPNVVAVVSGGYWQSNGSSGFYRVIVRNSGFDHVSSQAVAEWVAEPREASSVLRVIRTHEFVAPGFYSLDPPTLERYEGRVRVRLQGVFTHEPERRLKCSYDLLPDGDVKAVKSCG
jgi:hypothetical protein